MTSLCCPLVFAITSLQEGVSSRPAISFEWIREWCEIDARDAVTVAAAAAAVT